MDVQRQRADVLGIYPTDYTLQPSGIMTARGGITVTRIGRAASSANQATAPQSPAPAQAAPTKRTAASTANQLAPAPASSSMAKPLARKSKCSDVSGTNGPRAPCPDDEISRPITSVGKTSWGERRGRKGYRLLGFAFGHRVLNRTRSGADFGGGKPNVNVRQGRRRELLFSIVAK